MGAGRSQHLAARFPVPLLTAAMPLAIHVVETGHKLLFAFKKIMFPVYIFLKKKKGNVLEMYGNKTV